MNTLDKYSQHYTAGVKAWSAIETIIQDCHDEKIQKAAIGANEKLEQLLEVIEKEAEKKQAQEILKVGISA